jgi:hypothetical protein
MARVMVEVGVKCDHAGAVMVEIACQSGQGRKGGGGAVERWR